MNRERLIQLQEILRGVPQKRFNMGTWMRNEEASLRGQYLNGEILVWGKNVPECGTVACAAGWHALNPEAVAQGFHLAYDSRMLFGGILTYDDGELTWTGYGACERFYGLSEEAVIYIFAPDGYDRDWSSQITVDEVLEHIQDVLDGDFEEDGDEEEDEND